MTCKYFCRHCREVTGMSKILCDTCAHKAMQVISTDPEERVLIYKVLLESENPIIRMCAEQLIQDDYKAIEHNSLDPADRMFNPRG